MTPGLRFALWPTLIGALAFIDSEALARIAEVPALRETPPVGASVGEDAADDPAIFRTGQGQIRILGTNKKGGLFVYDLEGRIVEERPGGRPNNVDVYKMSSGATAAVASDRTDNAIAVWDIDPQTGALSAAPKSTACAQARIACRADR
jgi:3-phytase